MGTQHEVKTRWIGDMSFESELDGHTLLLDTPVRVGGKDLGPTPKPLLLSALEGCTGMDVVTLLNKMRIHFSDFNMEIKADLTDEIPKVYKNIHLIYEIKIDEQDREKMEKAVRISQDNLCSVSAMLKKVCPISWEIRYR